MGGDHSIYEGAHSLSAAGGFTTDYALPTVGYSEPASSFGLTTHPQNANVLKEVADKINSGIKAIEITAILPNILESVPEQHWDEIRRLKELTGVELTFHGPIVEATGITGQGKFDPLAQKKAEREMWRAVESAQRLNPKGNTVVTFHSASGSLPETITYTKEGGDKVQGMLAYNEFDERIAPIPIKKDFLEGKEITPEALLKQVNERTWQNDLSNASFSANRAQRQFEEIRNLLQEGAKQGGLSMTPDEIIDVYKSLGTDEGRERLKKIDPKVRAQADFALSELNHGETTMRQAYSQMKELYNQAYETLPDGSAEKNKLEEFRKELLPKIKDERFKDTKNIMELAEEVARGLQMLSHLEHPPQIWKPFHDVAIEKASETFSNVAFDAYKKYGGHAPIISIENPPAGSSQQGAGGLSRGQDLKDIVEKTRDEFVKKAMEDPELGLTKKEAEEQAKKLIGVTWDVGHINMIRQHGFTKEDVLKETEKVAPFVKHVHLSDNFGINHTELPMGMGNVPTKEHLELIGKFNKQAKKIIETGDWWNHFKRNPFPDTLQAFGSPVYAMKMSPYWNQARGMMGGYFSGFGMNPDHHHQVYGAGFSNLPVELGGQMSGRNRLSGAPME